MGHAMKEVSKAAFCFGSLVVLDVVCGYVLYSC